jgi:hypothetical protein
VGDLLSVGALPPGILSNIVLGVGTITVQLTGAASLAAYQTAIEAVLFSNTSDTPDTTDRIIQVSVNDGSANSNVETTIINVVPTNDAPNAVNDIVRTNFDGTGFNVPEWAFLRNDTDPEGNPLDITAVSDDDDLTAVVGAGVIAIDDDNSGDGGDFDYVLSDGTDVDEANVQVFNLDGGGNVTGTAANEILVGQSSGNVFTGGQGADIMFGGGGSDSFAFGSGDSGQTLATIDIIGDYAKGIVGTGDEIDYTTADLVIGGTDAAPSFSQASINQTTGVATFEAGSGTTFDDAINDVAGRISNGFTTAGEFALFQVNGAGDYYLFISDSTPGVSSSDVITQLFGVNSIGSINLAAGDLTITS